MVQEPDNRTSQRAWRPKQGTGVVVKKQGTPAYFFEGIIQDVEPEQVTIRMMELTNPKAPEEFWVVERKHFHKNDRWHLEPGTRIYWAFQGSVNLVSRVRVKLTEKELKNIRRKAKKKASELWQSLNSTFSETAG